MYNLFFFCKETKLKRKLWLQTVFHTKGRERKWKSAQKTSLCYFPPANVFLGTYNRGLPLFCKESRIWRSGFPLKSLWICEMKRIRCHSWTELRHGQLQPYQPHDVRLWLLLRWLATRDARPQCYQRAGSSRVHPLSLRTQLWWKSTVCNPVCKLICSLKMCLNQSVMNVRV